MRLPALLDARGPAALILVRAMVGAVFLSEGLQKFLFPAQLGSGRFEKIGFAAPQLLAPFVGSFEVACGTLVLLGLATRLVALPLIAVMLTAIVTTKLPMLLGHGLGPFQLRSDSPVGFWAMAHEARTDWSMLLGCVFLSIVGSGRWSLDGWVLRRRAAGSAR